MPARVLRLSTCFLQQTAAKVNHRRVRAGKRSGSLQKQLQKQLQDFEVPSVLEYVAQKEQVQGQRKEVSTWHRRLEVAQ